MADDGNVAKSKGVIVFNLFVNWIVVWTLITTLRNDFTSARLIITKVVSFLKALNIEHLTIQFTRETECDNILNFFFEVPSPVLKVQA